ncbi:MAG: AmmeMemoRadiSam system protein A [Ignavibacteriaceae bacterium]
MSLSDEEKGILLLSVREALNNLFNEESKFPEIDYEHYPELSKRNTGAFVTLTSHGQLRGCIGFLTSEGTLFETVMEAAQEAATNDPRFSAITPEDLSNIEVEISVLSQAVPINNYEEIIIGQHGLILDSPPSHAVLLPQVAVEQEFSTSEFLSALCEKAGLESNVWMDSQLNIKVFTASIFSEIGKRKITNERY